METPNPNDKALLRIARAGGNAVAALWIFGGMFFFFLRFSAVFYHANKAAVDSFLARFLR
jgi:hypothetical protein